MACPESYSGALVSIDGSLASMGVVLAYTIAWGPPVNGLDPRILDSEFEVLIKELRSKYTLESLKDDPRVRGYRDFYWRIGIDPTKTRPSSEALVRRALKGPLPRINPVVDAGNIASARWLVPVGLYDMDSLMPPLRLTLTVGGERFTPIGGGVEELPPGIPVMVDASGRIVHVYPHRDSVDTAVKPSTTRILAVAAGVPGIPPDVLAGTLRELGRLLGLLGWNSCPPVTVGPGAER